MFNDAINFSPTVSVAHRPLLIVFLCPAGVCFKVVWFAQIPIGCRGLPLGGVDLDWVALITTGCCQTVDLLMSKVGPSLDPLEQQEAKNHQVVEAHTYHSEPFHKELPHTRISTGTHM